MTQHPIQIDESAALAALNNNRRLLADLSQMFVEDAPNLLEQFKAALADDKADDARRTVHSIKGLFSTFFAPQATELAQQLEAELASGISSSVSERDVDLLEDTIRELSAELQARGLVRQHA